MPAPRAPRLTTLNRAYTFFLIAGIGFVLAFSLIAQNRDNLILIGFFMFPIGLLVIAGLIAAVVMGLRHWRHRPLLLLAVSSLFVVPIGAIGPAGDPAVNFTMIAWGAFMVIVPAWWFAKGRRNYLEKLSPLDQGAPPGPDNH